MPDQDRLISGRRLVFAGLALVSLGLQLLAIATFSTLIAWLRPRPCQADIDRASLASLDDLYAVYQRGGGGLWELVFSQDPNCAQPYFRKALALHPKHAEADLALALIYADDDEAGATAVHAAAALALGEPPEAVLDAFRLQPRSSLTTRLASGLLDWAAPSTIAGPIVSLPSPGSALIWVKTRDPAIVSAAASPFAHPDLVVRAEPVPATRQSDNSVTLQLQGILPDTLYSYQISINGRQLPGKWRFRTFPRTGQPSTYSIAFGGCSDYVPQNFRIFTSIASHSPLAFLTLGDNAYIDAPTNPSSQRFSYERLQTYPPYARLIASTATFAVWDDHDFATDNSWGGPEPESPPWKTMVWRIFEQSWPVSNMARPDGTPGVWQKISLGDVDIFMLDSRYYRTDPAAAHPSMLGGQQEAWLLDGLARSSARFKVIASPVMWSTTSTPSVDTWDGFPEERQRIFDWIQSQQIDGVILLSADRHRSDVWRIPRPGAYDLYEFESSRLTNDKPHAEDKRAIFSFNKKPSFGLLSFDFSQADPEARYDVVDIDNQIQFTYTVRLSQISTPR